MINVSGVKHRSETLMNKSERDKMMGASQIDELTSVLIITHENQMQVYVRKDFFVSTGTN